MNLKRCLSILATTFLFTASYTNAEPTDIPIVAKNNILHLTYVDTAGIGNRLKKTVSYLRYYTPKHLNIYWPSTGWVNARFTDLFAPEWETTITEYNSPYMIENFAYNQPLANYVSEYTLLVAANEFKDNQHRFIDLQYNHIPPEILKLYRPYFKALKPSPAVKKRIQEVTLPSNTVAVQIRNAPDWKRQFNTNEDIQNFFVEMDKFPPNTIFYLSAMSKESAAPFYKRYPNRIIELPNKDYHSMVDATADMYLLGATKTAIYQYGSTFAEVGWWLGGAKTQVIIIGNKLQENGPTLQMKVMDEFPKH
ncbi:MAG: hypothetical protein NC218_06870 [Acetobacter sp.]|nr:hypothetical protein [Acetobacter sp.]